MTDTGIDPEDANDFVIVYYHYMLDLAHVSWLAQKFIEAAGCLEQLNISIHYVTGLVLPRSLKAFTGLRDFLIVSGIRIFDTLPGCCSSD